MKLFITTVFLAFPLMTLSGTVQAQGVYVTKGENGPVFSDKPQAGAKEVSLKPLTIVPAAKEPKERAAKSVPVVSGDSGSVKPDAVMSGYRSFSVVFPENNGSVVANTGAFEVRLAVDPPLLLGDGHAFVVSINGVPVGQRFTANEFMIPPEFWGRDLPPANQEAQLDASIIDASGQVLKKTAPVRFFMRYATLLNKPRNVLPRIAPPKMLPQKPKPETALPVGATMERVGR